MPPHQLAYVAGACFSLGALALIVIGAVGCFVRHEERWYRIVASIPVWLLVVASIVALYVYASETIGVLTSESVYERAQLQYRVVGDHAWYVWLEIGTVATPLLLLLPWLREQPLGLLLVGLGAQTTWLVGGLGAAAYGPGWW